MLGAFVAGRYATLFDFTPFGITKDGFKLTYSQKSKNIEKTDRYGETLFDAIVMGGNWVLQADSLEYASTGSSSGPFDALTLYSGELGELGPIGGFASDSKVNLSMTVTTGSAAANAGDAINTLTSGAAILTPNCDISLTFDSTLREFPIRIQLLPFVSNGGAGSVCHFVTT